MIPEFVGRLPVVATLDELDEAALISILVAPERPDQAVPALFEMEGCDLEFREDALRAVAHREGHAAEDGGARTADDPRRCLLDTRAELPSEDQCQEGCGGRAIIWGTKPYVIYESGGARPRLAIEVSGCERDQAGSLTPAGGRHRAALPWVAAELCTTHKGLPTMGTPKRKTS